MTTWLVLLASHPRYCPVCSGRGLVRVRATEADEKACVPCPHCTDPRPLLNLTETQGKR